MALIKCPECGKEISDKSKQCIHCGYPLDEPGSILYNVVYKGFGMFPNKYAQVGTAVHCLLRPSDLAGKTANGEFFAEMALPLKAKMKRGYRRALLATDDCILASKSKISNFSQNRQS